ncbi:MAG: hypothetical protein ACLS8R_06945 [Anaeromassilibacillus sp.]
MNSRFPVRPTAVLGVELLGMWLLVDCACIPYAVQNLMNVLVILINYVSVFIILKRKPNRTPALKGSFGLTRKIKKTRWVGRENPR